MNKTKYPVYIISKGRWENPLTAKFFLEDGVDFKIVVEPQEAEQYRKAIGEKYVEVLPFSNLGLGSFPARNWCWEDALKKGYDRHWLFDDNINNMRRLHKGKRIRVNANTAMRVIEEFTDRYSNIGISGFNYQMFVPNDTSKPFYLNVHVYSALLIKNNMPYRWRLRYNEDTDLCLQVLTNGYCTVLFNAFMADKMKTLTMKGGNMSELYKGNGRLVMARALQEMWPRYVEVKWRFGRPQHYVDWKKHFKHGLIRRTDIDWDLIKQTQKFNIKLKQLKEIQSPTVKALYDEQK